VIVSSAKNLVQTSFTGMMIISSWRILMAMVEHSKTRMITTTMITVAKAMMAMMEMLPMEEKNIAENTLQSTLEMCIRNVLLIGMISMTK
jgi:hypothetical protein